MSESPRIYPALLAAMTDAAESGIAKLSTNKDQGYKFRGIEAAMNAMVPILIKHKIVVVPSYAEHIEAERETKSGGRMKFVRVKGVFKFVHSEDGSSIESICWGEGMDVSDKATAKAQSVAFRTALFTTFVVPTTGVHIDNEGDDGGAGGDQGDDIPTLLQKHIKEVRLLKTDAEARDYWVKERVAFKDHPNAYGEFRDATVAHRQALAKKATQGAPA